MSHPPNKLYWTQLFINCSFCWWGCWKTTMAVDQNAQLLTATFRNWRYAPEQDGEPHSNLSDDLEIEPTSSVYQNGGTITSPVSTVDQQTHDAIAVNPREVVHSHESATRPRLERTPPPYTEGTLPPYLLSTNTSPGFSIVTTPATTSIRSWNCWHWSNATIHFWTAQNRVRVFSRPDHTLLLDNLDPRNTLWTRCLCICKLVI